MRHWLVKSEAGVYSIDDLERDGRTLWDGVRNFRARNYMREMGVGDLVLFYHSSQEPPAVVGIARVAREAYPDPTQFDPTSDYHDPKSDEDAPRWWLVDLAFSAKLPRPVTLPEIKEEPSLRDMVLVRNARLSVQPVTAAEFEAVRKMGGSR